jgi:hypothetical protein
MSLIGNEYLGWELATVERMRNAAVELTEKTEALEALLQEFNERGGFAEITADDGTPYKDVPDFCIRELGLSQVFVENFLIDEEGE